MELADAVGAVPPACVLGLGLRDGAGAVGADESFEALRDFTLRWRGPVAKSSIPLDEFSGSGATDRLHLTIREFNEAATAQTDQMIKLTRLMLVLTVLLFVGLIVQIVVAILALV